MRALLAMVLFASSVQAQSVTVVKLGRLIDGKGNVVTNAAVVVRGDRVERVLSATDALPAGANVIDLRPLTGLPGLIDVHTHMTFYWDRTP